jgi:hypothetical protein
MNINFKDKYYKNKSNYSVLKLIPKLIEQQGSIVMYLLGQAVKKLN